MSEPHVEKSPATAAAAAVGDYGRRARDWSAARLPGGQKTFWFIVGLFALVFVVWLIRPATNSQSNASRFGNGPMPVGVGRVTSGDVNVASGIDRPADEDRFRGRSNGKRR
jgi:hypothetical protein